MVVECSGCTPSTGQLMNILKHPAPLFVYESNTSVLQFVLHFSSEMPRYGTVASSHASPVNRVYVDFFIPPVAGNQSLRSDVRSPRRSLSCSVPRDDLRSAF